MINESDKAFMRANRAEIEQGRTTPVTLERKVVNGNDPYTGEPITTVTTETVQAIVKGFTGEVGGERLIVNGVAIQQGDVNMAFNNTINLEGVQVVKHEGIRYTLVNILPKGIGGTNRYECIARRAT